MGSLKNLKLIHYRLFGTAIDF